MIYIHCNKCEQLLGNSYLFYFLENQSGIIELASKPDEETLMTVLSKLVKFNSNSNEYSCKKCLSHLCHFQDTLYFKARRNVFFKENVYGKIATTKKQ